MLAVGANGVGKTNLLESLHFATQGFSPRTRTDRQLVRFGADGARVAAEAGPGEVLVSQTVKDLVAGSGIDFSDRGSAQLKGVPGEWRLYAART